MKKSAEFVTEAAHKLEEIKQEMESDEWHTVTDWMMLAEIDEEKEREIFSNWPC